MNTAQYISKSQVVVHRLTIKYDSTDLATYNFKNRFNYNSESIQVVFEKFDKQYTNFYQQYFPLVLFSDSMNLDLEDMVEEKIKIKRTVYDDLNNYDSFRTIESLSLKHSVKDSFYHLLSEVTFRQDICVGCTRDGWQNDMHGVIHFRYAIINKDKVVFYKEIFVPNYIDPTKKNKRNQDATRMFNQKMNDVLFHFIKSDLDKIVYE